MTIKPANHNDYKALYHESVTDPDAFWAEAAKRLSWVKFPTKIKDTSFHSPVHIKWYEDGILNACFNCVDRHLPEKANDVALIWEGDDPSLSRHITYQELKSEICKLSNALVARGVKKGDRVTIYMPMIPQAVYAMLACARIGAVHSVVFGGFSPQSIRDRVEDCESHVIITADEGLRGGKIIPLKANVDEAIQGLSHVHTVFVYPRTGAAVTMIAGRDVAWNYVDIQSDQHDCVAMNAEDPLFILYTSGSTGKPKGVLHTTGGYLVYASLTHEVTFDYRLGDVYWCTADVGWVTGHSYIVYGPLSNGAISVVFEGVPNYPSWSRFWNVIDKHKVNIFYTAPTAIRSLLAQGDSFVNSTSRKSLRVLGSVGEPINAEAWHWYHDIVGNRECVIVDTWWQTETGGHLITPMPFDKSQKAGSATKPFFGVVPEILDQNGVVLHGACEGNLVIADSWPGQMRTVYKDHARFEQTYFSTYSGYYFTGDGARRDDDGDYWITGRVDDVINVSGHRLGTAEIESAINEHDMVAESAVVGFPHDIKGQGIYAYVILNACAHESDVIIKEISQIVRKIIGPIATPDVIQFCAALPKTRSGKIMRRILRKIAAAEYDSLGDLSTLSDPTIIEQLKLDAQKQRA